MWTLSIYVEITKSFRYINLFLCLHIKALPCLWVAADCRTFLCICLTLHLTRLLKSVALVFLAACYIFMVSLQFVSWQICWTNMLELTFWCSCDIGQSNSIAAYIAYYHFSLSHTQSKRLYFSKHHFRDGDISVFQSLGGGNFTILSYVPNNNTKRSQKEWSLILFCNLIERIISWITIYIMFLCQCSPWFVILIMATFQEFMKTSCSLFCHSKIPGLCCIFLMNPFYTAVLPTWH